MNKLTNKCVAAIASLAMAGTLCVAGAVTMAGVAWAAVPPINQHPHNPSGPQSGGTGDQQGLAPWDAKNTTTTGSITIFKCDAAEGDYTPADANSPSCPAKHKPLKATFKVTKVEKVNNETLNYASENDWAKLADVVNDLNRNDETKIELGTGDDNVKTQETNETTGQTKFDNLSLGLYKVEETKAPAGYGANDMSVFYITLPLIKQEDGKTKYDYNPVVHPKNKNLTSTLKKVLSTDKGDNFVDVKDDIVYEISAGVNHPSGTLTKDSIKDFAVFDDAPNDTFETISKDNVIKSVTVDGLEKALEKTTDYTVSVTSNEATDAVTTDGDTKGLAAKHTRILVKFTPAGLGKIAGALNDAQKNKKDEPQVHVKFKFQLNKDYKGGTAPTDPNEKEENGHNKIVNKSGFFKAHAGNADKDPDPIISGDDDKGTSTNTFGYLQVNKHDKKTGAGLSDAEFKLFNSKDKADACNAALLKETKDQTQAAAENTYPKDCTDGASTNFNGKTVEGGKFQDAFKALAGKDIYLVEMKAPTNYMRYPGAVAVKLEEGKTKTVDFPNSKIEDTGINTPWFNLPATGAAGVIIFAVAGMGLIAASVFLYMRNRKEEDQQQNA
ncbi:SpaH/EbpB family LPXTG-anchored major pilin [Gardnerella greenwoodii]|uniref:Putative surface-anchored protein (Fimbrial subunit) n=1 Tax=Gardnerella greenwoodii 00703Dmash TaxID=698960 RepID=I4M8C3_9BIFI|nr:SpaH/EbpB family LPXTG-anchored major pilin [Gardnerella greenwoodii]EIK85463.1 putative surface-anchored protein (fimbrial subunit) [Gardnerella greenwoodii 00703Dmash]